MAKIRKQIYLEKKHAQQLKHLAEALGVSQSEVIRQAIERETEQGAAMAEGPTSANMEAFNAFVDPALARRKLDTEGEPYKWNREEIYAEREDRYFRKDK